MNVRITDSSDVTAIEVRLNTMPEDSAYAGQRFATLYLGDVEFAIDGFDATAARRAIQIAHALTTAAFELLSGPPPTINSNATAADVLLGPASALTDDDILRLRC